MLNNYKERIKNNSFSNYELILDKEKKKSEKLKLTKSLIKIYSELYDYVRNGYTKPRFSNIIKDYSSNKTYNSNICICAVGKNENLYVRQFIEYYLSLGIDKIILYDNNDVDGEKFSDVLSDYFTNKQIEIIDVRGLSSILIPIYNYCYKKNNLLYDWIGFLDFDEYLYIENNETIKEYFYNERFNKCQSLFFNWVIYNDNDLIKYDNRSLIERFNHRSLNFSQGKSFVRGGIKNFMMPCAHIAGINVNLFIQKIFLQMILKKNQRHISNIFILKPQKNFAIKLIKMLIDIKIIQVI